MLLRRPVNMLFVCGQRRLLSLEGSDLMDDVAAVRLNQRPMFIYDWCDRDLRCGTAAPVVNITRNLEAFGSTVKNSYRCEVFTIRLEAR